MSVCYIIGAGECKNLKINPKIDDYVICADGGLKYAEKAGIKPNLAIGDFDSYGKVPSGVETVVLPCEKDETDTHFAINLALEKGYNELRLFGMLGGRPDHSFANLQLLSYVCQKGARATIFSHDYCATAIKNSVMSFSKNNKGTVSVFSLSPESKGVTIKGLKYEVNTFSLRSDCPMGVSNEFVGEEAVVSVEDGILLIMWETQE